MPQQAHTVTFYGSSDDLIEVEGYAPGCNEYDGESASFLVVGRDGRQSHVSMAYVNPGVWQVTVGPVDEGIPLVPARIYSGGDAYSAYTAVAVLADVISVARIV